MAMAVPFFTAVVPCIYLSSHLFVETPDHRKQKGIFYDILAIVFLFFFDWFINFWRRLLHAPYVDQGSRAKAKMGNG